MSAFTLLRDSSSYALYSWGDSPRTASGPAATYLILLPPPGERGGGASADPPGTLPLAGSWEAGRAAAYLFCEGELPNPLDSLLPKLGLSSQFNEQRVLAWLRGDGTVEVLPASLPAPAGTPGPGGRVRGALGDVSIHLGGAAVAIPNTTALAAGDAVFTLQGAMRLDHEDGPGMGLPIGTIAISLDAPAGAGRMAFRADW